MILEKVLEGLGKLIELVGKDEGQVTLEQVLAQSLVFGRLEERPEGLCSWFKRRK